LPLGGLIDLDKEKGRLEKRIKDIESLLIGIEKKLSNENFTKRAPENVVEHEKNKLNDLKDELTKVCGNLEVLC
jgi:valyl-tRNA synthetase